MKAAQRVLFSLVVLALIAMTAVDAEARLFGRRRGAKKAQACQTQPACNTCAPQYSGCGSTGCGSTGCGSGGCVPGVYGGPVDNQGIPPAEYPNPDEAGAPPTDAPAEPPAT